MSKEELLAKIAGIERGINNPKMTPGAKVAMQKTADGFKAQLQALEKTTEKKEEVIEKKEQAATDDLDGTIKKLETLLSQKTINAAVREKFEARLKEAKEKKESIHNEAKQDKAEAKKEMTEVKKAVTDVVKKVKAHKPGKKAAAPKPKPIIQETKRVRKSEKRVNALKAVNTSLQSLIENTPSLKKRYSGANVDLKRDSGRAAKPFGYRFVGKHDYRVPTKKQIALGKKRGTIDYEGRPNRADKFPKGVKSRKYGSVSDKLADGGNVVGGKFKFNIGDKVKVNDSGYVTTFDGFDIKSPATIISRSKVKSNRKTVYIYYIQTADGKKPFNPAREDRLTLVEAAKLARGGHVGKGELVWSKLDKAKRSQFLHDNFTPEITPRSQEELVGKSYNFLPKKVKIVIDKEYANSEEYADGGEVKKKNEVEKALAFLGIYYSKYLKVTKAKREKKWKVEYEDGQPTEYYDDDGIVKFAKKCSRDLTVYKKYKEYLKMADGGSVGGYARSDDSGSVELEYPEADISDSEPQHNPAFEYAGKKYPESWTMFGLTFPSKKEGEDYASRLKKAKTKAEQFDIEIPEVLRIKALHGRKYNPVKKPYAKGKKYPFSEFANVKRGTKMVFHYTNFGAKGIMEFIFDKVVGDRAIGWFNFGKNWEYGDYIYDVNGIASRGSGADALVLDKQVEGFGTVKGAKMAKGGGVMENFLDRAVKRKEAAGIENTDQALTELQSVIAKKNSNITAVTKLKRKNADGKTWKVTTEDKIKGGDVQHFYNDNELISLAQFHKGAGKMAGGGKVKKAGGIKHKYPVGTVVNYRDELDGKTKPVTINEHRGNSDTEARYEVKFENGQFAEVWSNSLSDKTKKAKSEKKPKLMRKNSRFKWCWTKDAVKDGIIGIRQLNKTPSKFMRRKYPAYIMEKAS